MIDPRLQARALKDHWLRTRQLPDAKSHPLPGEDISMELSLLESRFRDLSKLDNSLDDFDDRPNHLLLKEEPYMSIPARAEYSGTLEHGRVDVLWLEWEGASQETTLTEGRFIDSLFVQEQKQGVYLQATRIDRFSPGQSRTQSLELPWLVADAAA